MNLAQHHCFPSSCSGMHVYDRQLAAALGVPVGCPHDRGPFTCRCGRAWKPTKDGGWEPDERMTEEP